MKRISKKTRLLWRLRLVLTALTLEISAFFLLKNYPIAQIAVTVLIICAFAVLFFVYLPLCYRNFFYKIQDGTLFIKKGVIYRSEKQIPVDKIQYISFVATPLERLLGLKTAVVYTAGSTTLIISLDKHDDI